MRRGSVRRGMRRANENRRLDASLRRAAEEKRQYWRDREKALVASHTNELTEAEYTKDYEPSFRDHWMAMKRASYVEEWQRDIDRWNRADSFTRLRQDEPRTLEAFLDERYRWDRQKDIWYVEHRIKPKIAAEADRRASTDLLKEHALTPGFIGWAVFILFMLAALLTRCANG